MDSSTQPASAPMPAPAESGDMHRHVLSAVVVEERFEKRPASVLETIHGLDKIHKSIFFGKSVRQMAKGQVDKNGNDISHYIVVSDAAYVLIFNDKSNSLWYANNKNQVNIHIAPSLRYIESDNYAGGQLAVASMTDIGNIMLIHPKMMVSNVNIVNAYAQLSAETVNSIARSVQENTSSIQGLSPDCFVVCCMNASLYGKRMRDILIVDFYIDSELEIRFRSSDSKVVMTDLLVGVGKYTNTEEAQNAMSLMFEKKMNL